MANDLVVTTTFTGELGALSRTTGAIVWTAQLPAGSNATLASAENVLFAGAGLPLSTTQQPVVVAYRLGTSLPRRPAHRSHSGGPREPRQALGLMAPLPIAQPARSQRVHQDHRTQGEAGHRGEPREKHQ